MTNDEMQAHDRITDALRAKSADDLRNAGWSVAVHNDYTLNGARFTFWLFTKGSRFVRGEGSTDAIALDAVREQIGMRRYSPGTATSSNATERRHLASCAHGDCWCRPGSDGT